MSRKNLKSLFHINLAEYKNEYNRRFNDEDTIHLPVYIGENQAFICQTPEIYKMIVNIERMDKALEFIELPSAAKEQYMRKCLIDEIILTNNIEGVHSTRKEIGDILHDLSKKSKKNRFVGLVAKYEKLAQREKLDFNCCGDIRKLYDDIFYEEIKATDPENLPDGKIFRKSAVEVLSASQKVIHKGLYPESKVIDAFEKSLEILNDKSIDYLIRTAVFHYLFGYIHPFYDGNGRTSRFISSYLLSQNLNSLIAFRLSYTIKENIKKYYEAFDICNNSLNKGELTPFVEMFIGIVESSMKQLLESLEEKRRELNVYEVFVKVFLKNEKDLARLYYVLIQATLFTNIGISRDELISHMECSGNTLTKMLNQIPEKLLIVNQNKNRKFYLLNLDEINRLLEESV
ncbi:MAG: Fic family protein [Ruminococcus sp.]|nr:Fic family protein [Ruminococcus sp.]